VIRPYRSGDAGALAALVDEDEIPHAVTGDGVRHWFARQPERAHVAGWVAEEDGEPVGSVRARLRWATSAEGVGELWVFVLPRARGRGLGGALYEEAHEHLKGVGARVLGSWTTGEAGARFLAARGYRPSRTQEILRLDVASADLSDLDDLRAGLALEGYELVALSAVADRAQELYALDAGATADVPGSFAEDDVRLDDWLAEALGHPQLTREGSTVVLFRGEPVAYASSTSPRPRGPPRTR
jgi:GNAT superfamily N-acetyltransferase